MIGPERLALNYWPKTIGPELLDLEWLASDIFGLRHNWPHTFGIMHDWPQTFGIRHDWPQTFGIMHDWPHDIIIQYFIDNC